MGALSFRLTEIKKSLSFVLVTCLILERDNCDTFFLLIFLVYLYFTWTDGGYFIQKKYVALGYRTLKKEKDVIDTWT